MANRYWVGDSGNWSDDATHWAAASGGAPGAGNLPTAADDVYFDGNSFSGPGEVVTIDASAEFLSMDWTGSGANTPELAGGDSISLTAYGDITFETGVVASFSGTINVNAHSHITFAGISFDCLLYVDCGDGISVYIDQFDTSNNVYVTTGTLILSGDISCDILQVQDTLSTGGYDILCSTFQLYSGATLTHGVTPLATILTVSSSFLAYTGAAFTCSVVLFESISLTNDYTFASLTLTAGKTYTITAAKRITVTTLTANGSAGSYITIKSSSNTTRAYISMDSTDYWIATYCKLYDIYFIGTAVKYATYSIDGGNNLGIEFKKAVQELLDRIDEIYPNQATDAQVCNHLNSAAKKYFKEMKQKKTFTLTTVADVEEYNLPTDCNFRDITYVGVTTDTTIDDESEFTEYEFVKLEDIEGDDTTERYYNADNHQIGLLPVIDTSGYNIKIIYFATMRQFSAQNLDDVVDCPEEWHDILVYYVVSLIASMGNDPDVQIADYWRRMAEEEYAMSVTDSINTPASTTSFQVEEYIC